jgi:hypothetical protein
MEVKQYKTSAPAMGAPSSSFRSRISWPKPTDEVKSKHSKRFFDDLPFMGIATDTIYKGSKSLVTSL